MIDTEKLKFFRSYSGRYYIKLKYFGRLARYIEFKSMEG